MILFESRKAMAAFLFITFCPAVLGGIWLARDAIAFPKKPTLPDCAASNLTPGLIIQPQRPATGQKALDETNRSAIATANLKAVAQYQEEITKAPAAIKDCEAAADKIEQDYLAKIAAIGTQRSAVISEILMWFAALGFPLSAATLLFLRDTLKANELSAKAAEASAAAAAAAANASEKSLTSSRAWLAVKAVLTDFSRGSENVMYGLSVDVENIGETPAIDCEVSVCFYTKEGITLNRGPEIEVEKNAQQISGILPKASISHRIGKLLKIKDIEKNVQAHQGSHDTLTAVVDIVVSYRTKFDRLDEPKRQTMVRYHSFPTKLPNEKTRNYPRDWLLSTPVGAENVKLTEDIGAPTLLT